ncbi:unnamed protein product [Clonostachys solani]|uniref:Uncharacterized protein n=1 Tax=Clonostachys solani TaxID=160281 RepID=A0A9N9W5X2_9HYPO|nr:unnamed protein product [Clonostachys solani]
MANRLDSPHDAKVISTYCNQNLRDPSLILITRDSSRFDRIAEEAFRQDFAEHFSGGIVLIVYFLLRWQLHEFDDFFPC